MSTPPQAPPRLIDSDTATGRLVAAAARAPLESTPARRERLWLTLHARGGQKAFFVPALAVIAIAIVAGVSLQPRPLPPASVALVSGAVEFGSTHVEVGQTIPSDSALTTGRDGRVFLRFTEGGALFFALSQVKVETADGRVELQITAGDALVHAKSVRVTAGSERLEARDAMFSVKVATDESIAQVIVYEGAVQLRGSAGQVALSPGQSWSPEKGVGPIANESRQLELVRALTVPQASEAVLDIRTSAMDVTLDGLALGPSSTTLLASQGAHRLSADFMSAETVVVPAGGVRHALESLGGVDEARAYEKARQLASEGMSAEAIGLYRRVANGQSRRAETALYEVGRIQLRVLHDPSRAAFAFDEYLRRFAEGSLRQEVVLSLIEARLQAGDATGALGNMQTFLHDYPDSERATDVRFLQAQAFREGGNCQLALGLFEQLASHPKYGDDSLYFIAWCQRASPAAARTVLESYLKKFPDGKHRAEAKAALGQR
jgi:TolA-binding protein